MIEVKIALCSILKNFKVETTERTPKDIEFDKYALPLRSKDEIFVKFVKDPLF